MALPGYRRIDLPILGALAMHIEDALAIIVQLQQLLFNCNYAIRHFLDQIKFR